MKKLIVAFYNKQIKIFKFQREFSMKIYITTMDGGLVY